LKDGTSFIIPMKLPSMPRLEDNKLHFSFSQAHDTHIVQENIIGVSVIDKPEGWRASVIGCSVRIQAPAETKEDYDRSGFVSVIATSGDQTFIGKIYVTLDRPLFDMSVSPDGRMTLTELDTDFNSPGFLAGFCKAEDFDPKAIAAHADGYHNAEDKESFYLSWNSYMEGKTYGMSLASSVSDAVPGQKYAAYCLPGSYSKWIGSKASEYDVCVKYFTYSKVNFAANGVGVDKANLSISMLGAESFYGGIMMYTSDDELPAIAEEFLSDAAPAIGGSGAGVFGTNMKSYSGKISLFAAPLDGDGKPSERTILPGAKYAIGIIPIDGERVSGEYSVDDVIIKTVEMNQPSATSTVLVTAKEGAKTTTSASATFDITAAVSKFFYRVVPESELAESGMSELQYVLAKGICWDRAIMQASGAISGIDDNCTNLTPGTKCKAIGAGFTTKGEYYLVSIGVTSDEVRLSGGNLSLDSFSTSVVNANSTKITVKFTASSEMTEIRYIDRLTKQEYEQVYGSEDNVFSILTSGSRWDYSSVDPSSDDTIEMYVSPSDTEFILFAVGMDSDGAYTKLKKIEIKL
ncbi:MAG: hypothetical protein KBS67_02080, partial [Bacteroidales bacterium]|nr:hypothetical protein [Candidatus Cryptobacteroides equifaecalis]